VEPRVMIVMIIVMTISMISLIMFILLLSRKNQLKKHIFGKQGHQKSGEGVLEGVSYYYRYYPGSRNSPSYFKVAVNYASQGKFTLMKENGFDRFAKKIGLSLELETGDSSFDNKYFISSDYNDFIRNIFGSRQARTAVNALFEIGYNKLTYDRANLTALLTPFSTDKTFDQEAIENTVKQLLIIREQIQRSGEINTAEVKKHDFRRILVFGSMAVIEISGIIALIAGVTNFNPLDDFSVLSDSLKYSLPVLLVFVWLSFQLLKGYSSSHNDFLAVLIFCLFGFPISGWGFETFYNGKYDTSLSTFHEVYIIEKTYSSSKNGKTYYAVTESWRKNGQEKIKISWQEYESISEKNMMRVETGAGKMGFEWLKNYEIYSPESVEF